MRRPALTLFAILFLLRLHAGSTITQTNRYAWGANLGWVDWRADATNGAVIGEFTCAGFIHAANVGWISLGGGVPTNGIQYQNVSGADCGVNHDGLGNLRGYAYGANIGWINFENSGAPSVDLKSGRLTGYAYSANCGWISLSNGFAVVQTATIAPGPDTDGDGMADAWERNWFGSLAASPGDDADGDGASNLQEYLAGTSPLDSGDRLIITAQNFFPGGTSATLTWKSSLTRCYFIEKNPGLVTNSWLDSGLGLIFPDGAATSRTFGDTNAPIRFYRVRAVKPLSP